MCVLDVVPAAEVPLPNSRHYGRFGGFHQGSGRCPIWAGVSWPRLGLHGWRLRVDVMLVYRRHVTAETRGGGREGRLEGSPSIWSEKWLTCSDNWRRCVENSRQLPHLACLGQTGSLPGHNWIPTGSRPEQTGSASERPVAERSAAAEPAAAGRVKPARPTFNLGT